MYELVVRRPVAVTMVVIGIIVFGIIAYQQLPLNLMPNITYPRLTIRTEYPGSGPEEVEMEISRPVESILGTIGHLARITSRSRSGISEVILEFDWRVDINLAMQEVREKLDLLRLPDEAKRPILLRYDPNLDPMMRLGLSSRESNLYQLRLYAEEVLQPALETMLGVAAVQIRGGLQREVEVALDENKMRGLQLNIDVVTRRLKEENINLAGGQLQEGTTYYWVRTLNEFQSLEDMGKLIVDQRQDRPIRLLDIAKLRFRNKDPDVITRINGLPSVELAVFREADANIVTVAQVVHEKIFGSPQQRAYVQQQLLQPTPTHIATSLPGNVGVPPAQTAGKMPALPGRGSTTSGSSSIHDPKKGHKPRSRGDRKSQQRGKKERDRKSQQRSKTREDRKDQQRSDRKSRGRKDQQRSDRKSRGRKDQQRSKTREGRKDQQRGDRKSRGRKDQRRGKKGGGRGGHWKIMREEREKKRKHREMTNYLLYQMPPDYQIQVLHNQATFIKSSIDEVLDSAIVGGGFAVLILLLFMRDLWGTLIIGLSIPLSVVATFAGLYLSGVSLNIMSLGGLALGIGMLVDNSIVVLESILRFREEGVPPDEAAVKGVEEVGGAVIASTLTTVAVFFPIVFVQGVSGQLLRDLALTVVYSLMSSLFVALYFIPTLSALRLPVRPPQSQDSRTSSQGFFQRWIAWQRLKEIAHWWTATWHSSGWKKFALVLLFPLALVYALLTFPLQSLLELLSWIWRNLTWGLLLFFGLIWKILAWIMRLLWTPIFWLMDRFLDGINWLYPRILNWTLRNTITVVVLTLLLGGYTYTMLPRLQREFMPKVHQGEFNLEIAFPAGTPLLETARRLELIEKNIAKHPQVANVSSVIGVEKTEVQSADKGEHTAVLTLKLKTQSNLEHAENKTIQDLRTMLQTTPGLDMKISYPSLFSLRTPIEVEIKGENLRELGRLSQEANQAMKDVAGLRDIRTTALGGLPEIRLQFQRERLIRYGFSVEQLSKTVRDKLYGATATKYRLKEQRLDVSVRIEHSQLKSLRDLMDLSLVSPVTQAVVPLRHLVDLQIDEGPSEILRVGNRRAVVLRAEVEGISLGDVTSSIEGVLHQLKLPGSYSAGLSGQSEEMKKSLNSLLFALLLSIFLVYLVMASQFESLLSPFIILFSIPLAFIGVVILFVWLNMPMSAMVMIGAIILTGIVVNNAIVLVDAINHLRERGIAMADAIRQAGVLRLRPILMTTLTTVLGLIPLALGLGEGSELRRPMAITIIVGLLFSTLLTLLLIPALYQLSHKDPTNTQLLDSDKNPGSGTSPM